MTTSNKNFKVKNGLEVLGTSATVDGEEVLTKSQASIDYLNTVVGGEIYSYGETPPENPGIGDRWVDSNTGFEFTWLNDGTSTQWVETRGSGYVGPANELTLGTVTTGAAGTDVDVEITGESPSQTINFTIPRGDKGDQGDQGIQGVSLNVIGSVANSSLFPSTGNILNDAYIDSSDGTISVWDGTTWNNVGQFVGDTGPQGIQGEQGIQGIQGEQGNPGQDATNSPTTAVVVGVLAGNQALTNASTDTPIDFVDSIDPQGWWNPSTKKFLPNVAGYYNVTLQTLWSSLNTTSQTNVQIRKNGNTESIQQRTPDANVPYFFSATKIIYLNGSTDYVEFTVWSPVNTQSLQQGNGAGSGTSFSAALLTAGLGTKGDTGDDGAAGAGVAVGGTAGQILSKVDGTDYNTEWVDNQTTLNGLTDVDTTGAADGNALVYDDATSTWIPGAGGGGGTLTADDTKPTSPSDGAQWYDTTIGKTYVYINDGNSSQWVEQASAASISGEADVRLSNAEADILDLEQQIRPVILGGTGATNASDARTNLEITPANIGAAETSHSHVVANITDLASTYVGKSSLNYAQSNSVAITVNTTTPTTVASIVLTTNGRPVFLSGGGDMNPAVGGNWHWFQIYRDSTALGKVFLGQTSAASSNLPFWTTVIDTPAAGTYTYSLRVWQGSGSITYGENGNSNAPHLVGMELF